MLNIYVQVSRQNAVMAGKTTYGVTRVELDEADLAKLGPDGRYTAAGGASERDAIMLPGATASKEALVEYLMGKDREAARRQADQAQAASEHEARMVAHSRSKLAELRQGAVLTSYWSMEGLTVEEAEEARRLEKANKAEQERRDALARLLREEKEAKTRAARRDALKVAATKLYGEGPRTDALMMQHGAGMLFWGDLTNILRDAHLPLAEGQVPADDLAEYTSKVGVVSPESFLKWVEAHAAYTKQWPGSRAELVRIDGDDGAVLQVLVTFEVPGTDIEVERFFNLEE